MKESSIQFKDALAKANECVRAFAKCVNERFKLKDIPEIYHYTSAAGLYGILQNEKIWFTRWDCLNDYTEYRYIHEIIGRYLNKFSNDSEFCALVSSLNEHERSYKKDAQFVERRFELYVASFSTNKDALNLWTYYTKSTHNDGYCLGLDYKSIFTDEGYDIITSEVVYDQCVQDELITELLTHFHGFFTILGSNNVTKRDRNRLMWNYFRKVIRDIGLCFKPHAFNIEEEVRAVLRPHNNSKTHKKLNVRVRQRNGLFIPYVEMPVKKTDIKRIGISPTLKYTPARGGVSSLVKEYDLSCDIYESDIPLRNI